MYMESRLTQSPGFTAFNNTKRIKTPTIDDLDHLFQSNSTDEASFAYNQGFALTNNLIDNFGIHKIAELLGELSKNKPFNEAFNHIYSDYNLSFNLWWENISVD